MPLTAEQHTKRRRGVGASEVSAILGVNPWKRPIDVQRDKLGLSEPSPPSPETERGDFDELALRPWYAHRYQRRVEEVGTLQDEALPLLIATPDGISHPREGDGDRFLLEIKSPGQYTQWDWGDNETDQVPIYHVPQVLWGMAVTGLKVAHLVARVRCEMRLYIVPFDQSVFDDIYRQVDTFWRLHVVEKRPCAPDHSDQYAEHLAKAYGQKLPSSTLQGCPKASMWAKRLIAGKARREKAEREVTLAKNNLKALMGSNERMKTDFGLCTWKRIKGRTRIDYAALFEAEKVGAEAIAQHTTTQQGALVFNDYFSEGDRP